MTDADGGERPGRARSFTAVGLAYVVAAAAAVAAGALASGRSELVVALIADVAATAVIFAFSVRHDNSSVYDAYWSVAPPLLFAWWAFGIGGGDSVRVAVIGVLVSLWAVRLTWNWARGWPGMHHEDWRYVEQRRKTGRLYWLVSFAGLHLFPTLLVFAGCLPLWLAATSAMRFNTLDIVAAVVTLGAILIEATADRQLRTWRQTSPPAGAIMDRGLWAWSRHPNYFGELSFWWGVWLFGVAAEPGFWWIIVGPVGMTLLFLVVSIPMLDARSLERRPAYADHCRRVSAIVPLPPRRRKE